MPEIVIKTDGVEKLLRNLSPHKASGPDSLSNTILKNCATELAPVIADIFRQSLDSGSLPSDWRNANIRPVFKKGNKHTASNYPGRGSRKFRQGGFQLSENVDKQKKKKKEERKR